VKQFGCANNEKLNSWELNHKDIEKGVSNTFFYTEDIYDTEKISGRQCFSITSPEIKKYDDYYTHDKIKIRFYVPIEYLGTEKELSHFDEKGNIESRLQFSFNRKKSCEIKIRENVLRYGWEYSYDRDSFVKWFDITPPIKIKKGTQKNVDSRVKGTFVKACEDSLSSLQEFIDDTKSYIAIQKKLNETPFVPSAKRELVLDAFNSFLKDLENHKLNAEHLLEKVRSHAISTS
jgi:MoxR-like ATPase